MTNRDTDITALLAAFNSRVERFGLTLTQADFVPGESRYMENGDEVFPYGLYYRFNEDGEGLYLDYHLDQDYRTGPDHARLRPDGREEQLPVQNPGFGCPANATDEERQRLEQEYYAENRRISGMLGAKGFDDVGQNRDLPVQVVYVSRRDASGTWITSEECVFGWYGTCDAALGATMWFVDDYLERIYRRGMSVNELLDRYRSSGPDPFIRYEARNLAQAANPVSAWFFIYQPIPFNAWGYAETVARRLCGTAEHETSRSLAGWQGRYDRYDRHRMEAQLFLNRAVRLTRDLSDAQVTIPAGSTGKIAAHGRLVDTELYDYTREAPVMFDLTPEPFWRRLGRSILGADRCEPLVMAVPFDAMEFIESDAEYSPQMVEIYREIR